MNFITINSGSGIRQFERIIAIVTSVVKLHRAIKRYVKLTLNSVVTCTSYVGFFASWLVNKSTTSMWPDYSKNSCWDVRI